ncbi:hypothetical protein [Paenibacillus polymyxa]|uniref:Uncharacterized protein n=1 Tax=Paenibacillus polymyxa (strain SC2) TaxID=886882 RepID=E3E5A9_PAEPS|nr:hypothetical protein [Paenibacillus polymyxa]ADO57469.1 hypothetical protein PPSC2_16440 [Paenibacillus polymyxa SC2]WPQ55240.1 hypothetical protein SKN87_16760 [Paenibacillus polymyxa]CCI70131.1 hypothetical protein PPM_3322 [Paenibacillus polymyxa M1]
MSKQILNQILDKLQIMDDRIGTLENVQKSHGEHLQQLIQIVGTTNSKIEELTEDVSILKGNQQTMLQIQQEQQKILERLSVRSISQEADIAELRRIK